MNGNLAWTALACMAALACAAGSSGAEAAAEVSGAPVAPQRGLVRAVIVDAAPAMGGIGRTGAWAKCPPLALGECTTWNAGGDLFGALVDGVNGAELLLNGNDVGLTTNTILNVDLDFVG
ncbi:hypothetical protein LCGC14_2518540, partial [marine sediment metagenome]